MSSVPPDVNRETVIARVSKLQAFVTSTLLLLTVLTVITEQRIYEYENQVVVLARQRRAAAARLPVAVRRLNVLSGRLHATVDRAMDMAIEPLRLAASPERGSRRVDFETLRKTLRLKRSDRADLEGAVRLLTPGEPSKSEDFTGYEHILEKVTGLSADGRKAIDRMTRLPPPKSAVAKRQEIAQARAHLDHAATVNPLLTEAIDLVLFQL